MKIIINKLMPDYDFIFSLFDLSIVDLSKKAEDFCGHEMKEDEIITLFDIFEHDPTNISLFINRVSEKGEREWTKKIKNKGIFKVRARYAEFVYEKELYRIGKFLDIQKIDKLEDENTLEII